MHTSEKLNRQVFAAVHCQCRILSLLLTEYISRPPSSLAVVSIHLHLPLLVVLLQLFQELCLGLHHRDLVPPALGAVPLALGLRGELHAVKVEPLDGAEVVVAADHVTVGHLVAQAVRRLIGVYLEVAGVDLVPVRVVLVVVTPPRR